MSDFKVQEALRLLREAGRLDLIQGGVGGPSRPPRRASGRVAATVLACSTMRGGARKQAVSRRGRGRVRGRVGGIGYATGFIMYIHEDEQGASTFPTPEARRHLSVPNDASMPL
ncbi:hypothetical protein NDU88_005215 [Pleurodeles waltl]|uniref:Uncharacterized protein n=1 Tax=Pleurodeles waltl TaxID=8319 RepID=A0AAV7WBD3_PLEWA|nr:hypothetical protein NDU88_005215 [Pleurodeles waltl]